MTGAQSRRDRELGAWALALLGIACAAIVTLVLLSVR